MNFDRDHISLALIALLTVVWLSGVWQEDSIALAADVLKIGIAAIAGYMSRDPVD